MADQRPFRFRLPWFSAPVAPAPRPTAEPRPPRPTVEIQAPARPTTTIPIQRPPFRPAGIAPAPTPATQTTAREQTEPQPVPPRHAATESQVNSQPVSPSRETGAASVPPSPSPGSQTQSPSRETPQSIAASVLPSPSRTRTQPQAGSQTQSPSRETPQSIAASVLPSPSRTRTQPQAGSQTQSPSRATPRSRAASMVPSPSRTTSQPQSAAAVTVPQTQSSSGLATQVPGRKSPQLSSPSKTATQTQPTVSQSPSKKLATQEISQPPPKPTQSDTQQDETKPAPAAEPALESDAVTAATPGPTPVPALETPAALQKSDPRTIGADHPTTLSEPVKRAKEDIFERKKTTTISPNGENIKTARTRYAFGESHKRKSMSNGEKVPLHKEIGEDISKLVHKLGMEHMKHPMGEKSISIVTLAGENRGATMNMGFESTRKDGSIHIHRGYKINPDESSEATTDGEGSSKGRSSKDPLTKEPARKACINSNTQSVNNSMLFETSVSERNPGVQLNLSYIDEEPSKNSSKPVHLETRKAEFQVTPAEKLSYEPTVKRRCLRGLFMESSDSDLDNPEKPRRHGCRYDCGKKS
ncbi:isoflavone reductase family protein [Salix suchowensis]|nr:isoflavone reductase family protein [Salix suchowensis]